MTRKEGRGTLFRNLPDLGIGTLNDFGLSGRAPDVADVVRRSNFSLQQGQHVLGMFLFFLKDFLDETGCRRIFVTEPVDDLRIALNGDPLGNEVLLDHRGEIGAFDIFGMTPCRQGLRIEIRLAVQLDDAGCQAVRMLLLLRRVLEELRPDTLG
jgi:hypothetical protein